jgi:hypothetical protein
MIPSIKYSLDELLKHSETINNPDYKKGFVEAINCIKGIIASNEQAYIYSGDEKRFALPGELDHQDKFIKYLQIKIYGLWWIGGFYCL